MHTGSTGLKFRADFSYHYKLEVKYTAIYTELRITSV